MVAPRPVPHDDGRPRSAALVEDLDSVECLPRHGARVVGRPSQLGPGRAGPRVKPFVDVTREVIVKPFDLLPAASGPGVGPGPRCGRASSRWCGPVRTDRWWRAAAAVASPPRG